MTPGDQPRCAKCCDHGVPLTSGCGWCEDIINGMTDCIVPSDEPMWDCPHGVGEDPTRRTEG